MATATLQDRRTGGFARFGERLNSTWHRPALLAFGVVTLAHWAEHLVQAVQVWVLDRPRPQSRGVLGEMFPVLVTSEALHYAYAVVMLAALVALLPGFQGRARTLWVIALGIQVWHHLEHLLLIGQAQFDQNLFGGAVPTSVLQAVFPGARVEIHLFYNALVTIPMVAAMWLHRYPPQHERATLRCSCPAGAVAPAH